MTNAPSFSPPSSRPADEAIGLVGGGAKKRAAIHYLSRDEILLGRVKTSSRAACQAIIAGLTGQGAKGVILGGTGPPLLIGAANCPVSFYDTTQIHALSAVERARGEALATAHCAC